MKFAVLAVVSFALSTIAWGQTAPLRGVLTDSSDAVIPGATVRVENESGSKTAVTEANGSWSVAGLAAGDYRILHIEFPGFQSYDGTVTIGAQALPLAIRLAVGLDKQEVTVSADSDPQLSVDADHSAATTVMTGTDLDALPDDPDDLTDMLVALAGPTSSAGGGPQILADGFAGGQLPPKATIKQIRINQNPFSAAYDSPGFGRIEIITKPGAGNWHYQFGLTDSDAVFNSRNPYATNRADYVNRMISGNATGPIGKKVSVSLDYFHNVLDNSALINAVTLDPATLASVPVQQTVTTPRTDNNYTGKIDAQLSTNHSLTARYQFFESDRDNNGIGQYNLTSRAYSSHNSRGDLQVTESAVLTTSVVQETRFAWTRQVNDQYGTNSPYALVVAGAFSSGSAQTGLASNRNSQYELQSNTVATHGIHTLRFGLRAREVRVKDSTLANQGGTFTFFGADGISSLEQYRRTLEYSYLSPVEIRALGGGASQFSIATGNSLALVDQFDAGLYFQDDWRVRPNFTLNMGLRYEVQTNIHDKGDFSPRVGFAWSPPTTNGTPPKTVFRAGIGYFYNRIGSNLTLNEERFNGITQRQYLVTNPDFFPNIPPLGTLTAQPSNVYIKDYNLHPLDFLQIAVTLERQLPGKTNISVNYSHMRMQHLLSIVNINSPLPGTYTFGDPTSGIRPYGNAAGNIFDYLSGAYLNQNSIWTQTTTRFNPRVSLNLNYSYFTSRGNAVIDVSSPSNPFNLNADYRTRPVGAQTQSEPDGNHHRAG